MPKKQFSILIMLFALAWSAQSQTNVEIRCSSANAAGRHAELCWYDDMLSQSETVVDECDADSAGTFTLRCYLRYPRLVFIQIEDYSQSFYVEPGRNYEVWLPEFDWTIDERRNVHLDPVALPLEFLNLPADELNLRIGRFEAAIDTFLLEKRAVMDLRFRPDRRYFDTLEMVARAASPADSGTFFGHYCDYRMAELRFASRAESRKRILERCILGQEVRYWDEGYMRLFFALMDHCISKGTSRIPMHRLTAWVEEGRLEMLLDSIGLDPLLRNERIRELAALQALKEAYYDPAYNRERVKTMVERLAATSKFDEHKELALRLARHLTNFESGSEAEPFVLPDVDHNMVSLDSLLGKWIYLSFVRVSDPHSIGEIETMAHFRDTIYAKYPDVVFVSVSCDREFQKMYHFLKNNKRGKRYEWLWLHFDGNYRLLEQWGVVGYPAFYLINPDGELHYSVTPPPASGIFLHGPWVKEEVDENAGKSFFGN